MRYECGHVSLNAVSKGIRRVSAGSEGSRESMLEAFEIYRRLPHRFPMLMVDRVVELVSGERAVGIKNVTINEPFFTGHYPDRPIMPGVLILEAMAQVGGLALSTGDEADTRVPLFAAVEKAKFRRLVVPGDQLRIESKVVRSRASMSKITSVVTVGEHVVAEAELLFTLTDLDEPKKATGA